MQAADARVDEEVRPGVGIAGYLPNPKIGGETVEKWRNRSRRRNDEYAYILGGINSVLSKVCHVLIVGQRPK